MTNISQPYELEQIENINKLDEAKYLSQKLEDFISLNDFKDNEEKDIALNNLKCL